MVEPRRYFLLMFLIFLPVVVWREFQMMEAWTAIIYPNRNAPSVSERIGAIGEHPSLAARGRSTFSELRWYPPMEAAKGSLSWVFRAKQPESVRTGP